MLGTKQGVGPFPGRPANAHVPDVALTEMCRCSVSRSLNPLRERYLKVPAPSCDSFRRIGSRTGLGSGAASGNSTRTPQVS